MKIIILLFIITLFSSHSVFADDFNSTSNVDSSQLYMTSALGYELQPSLIEYNAADISEPFQNQTFSDYAVFLGDAYRRMIEQRDRVVVPPNTKIQIFSLLKNDSGHDIEIKNFSFFASRVNSMWGTWENLGILGNPGSLSYRIYGSNRTRTGFKTEWLNSYNILEGEEKNIMVGEFQLPTFIKVLEEIHLPIYSDDGSLSIKHSIKVKNDSNVLIRDILFTHGNYLLRRNFIANEVYTFEYNIDYGLDYELGSNIFSNFSISVQPEIHECVVIGSSVLVRNNVPDSRALFILRNDENNPSQFIPMKEIDWYPGNEGLCIDVLPYWIIGEELTINIQPITELSIFIKDRNQIKIDMYSRGANVENTVLNFMYNPKYLLVKNCCNANSHDSYLEWTINSRNFFCNLDIESLDSGKFTISNLVLFNETDLRKEYIEIFPDVEFDVSFLDGKLIVLNHSNFIIKNFRIGNKVYDLEKGENILQNREKENYSYREIVGSVENL